MNEVLRYINQLVNTTFNQTTSATTYNYDITYPYQPIGGTLTSMMYVLGLIRFYILQLFISLIKTMSGLI
jgi:hypothetical protein